MVKKNPPDKQNFKDRLIERLRHYWKQTHIAPTEVKRGYQEALTILKSEDENLAGLDDVARLGRMIETSKSSMERFEQAEAARHSISVYTDKAVQVLEDLEAYTGQHKTEHHRPADPETEAVRRLVLAIKRENPDIPTRQLVDEVWGNLPDKYTDITNIRIRRIIREMPQKT